MTMKNTLNQGFENHVLNYTLNQMLNQIKEVGVLDYCLDEILDLLLDEAFGKLCAEKELDNIPKKIKEMKNNKSLDSIQILAQFIDINTTLPKLIGFIDKYPTHTLIFIVTSPLNRYPTPYRIRCTKYFKEFITVYY